MFSARSPSSQWDCFRTCTLPIFYQSQKKPSTGHLRATEHTQTNQDLVTSLAGVCRALDSCISRKLDACSITSHQSLTHKTVKGTHQLLSPNQAFLCLPPPHTQRLSHTETQSGCNSFREFPALLGPLYLVLRAPIYREQRKVLPGSGVLLPILPHQYFQVAFSRVDVIHIEMLETMEIEVGELRNGLGDTLLHVWWSKVTTQDLL